MIARWVAVLAMLAVAASLGWWSAVVSSRADVLHGRGETMASVRESRRSGLLSTGAFALLLSAVVFAFVFGLFD